MSRYFKIKDDVGSLYGGFVNGGIYESIDVDGINGGIMLINNDFHDVFGLHELEEVFYNKYSIPSTCVDFSQVGGSYDRYDKRADGWSFSTTLLGNYDPIWSSIDLIDTKDKIRARFNIKKWKV